MNKHYKNFFGDILSKRRTKKHLLDEIRFRLILMCQLPGVSEDYYRSSIHSKTLIIRAARKTKKRRLSRVIRQLNEFIRQDKYDFYECTRDKDYSRLSTMRTIGNDSISTIHKEPSDGVKIGSIAVVWNTILDLEKDFGNDLTPYNDVYWDTVVKCHLYHRVKCESDDPYEIIQIAGEESIKEELDMIARGRQTPINNKE